MVRHELVSACASLYWHAPETGRIYGDFVAEAGKSRQSVDAAANAARRAILNARLPLEAAILEAVSLPVYQRIALTAVHLRRLGLSSSAAARRLGVTDKTVTKAIKWVTARDPEP